MMKFQEKKIEKLRKEYDKAEKFLLWSYAHPDDQTRYDKGTDLYQPYNVYLGLEARRKIRNKIKSIIVKNSLLPFLNLPQNEKNRKMEELRKEFDIIF